MIADENRVEFVVVLPDKAAELALVCTDKIKCFSIAVLLTALSHHRWKYGRKRPKP